MTWPTTDVVTDNLDAGADNPATARGDLLDLVQKFNALRAHVSTFAATVLAAADAAAARTALGAAAAGDMPAVFTPRSTRTSNTILGVSDRGAVIDITSGTFTQTLTAAATLGAGWWCWLGNSGSGDITLDANGSETIDGLTTFVMYPGEQRLLQCNGTAFFTSVLRPFFKVFASSGTFVKPPGYTRLSHYVVAGGMGGGRGVQSTGGGVSSMAFDAVSATLYGAAETVTVGAGGAGRSTTGLGNYGGSSSIGSLVVAAGSAAVGGGYVLSGGTAVFPTYSNVAASQGCGASCGYSFTGLGPGPAGPAVFDYLGAGGAGSTLGTASNGAVPGGGGGASEQGVSGAGARGEVRIWGVL